MERTAHWMSRIPETEATPETVAVASLVQRTLGGDPAAFEQIIFRYERRVFTLAMKLLGSRDDAQDAAQEVFLRAFKYLHRFDVRKPIEPWLIQVTVNVCRNIGRNRQRRWNTFPDVEAPDAASVDESTNPYSGV